MNLKKFVFPLSMAAALCVVAISCKKIDEKTQFNLGYSSEVVVPESSGIQLPFDILSPEVQTESQGEFAVNNTRKDLIEDIELTSLSMRIIDPADEDFSFLEEIEVYISAEGLSEIRVAWFSDSEFLETVDEFELTTTSNNLMEYIKAESFEIRCATTTDEYIDDDITIRIDSEFRVDAKILGQ